LLLIGGVASAGFTLLVVLTAQSDAELLATGTRTSGMVTQVRATSKGGWMDVRFAVGGVDRVRTIDLDGGSPAYHPGDHVTVIYDQADPDRIRTDVEAGTPIWKMVIFTALGVVILCCLPLGAIEYPRWLWRYRAVRKTGWRHGVATITMRGKRRVLDVRFDNGVTTRVLEGRLKDVPDRGDVELWVGGTAKAKALLFRSRPFLSAARTVVR